MNTRGNTVVLSMMIALVVVILGLALAPPLAEFTNAARNSTAVNFTGQGGNFTGMDCDNSSISNFDKAGCYASDLTLLWFIGSMIFLAGGIIGARIIFG